MNTSEFNALISLLDDTDPGVEQHVKDKLISMGEDAIPELERAWEANQDEFVQERIEDIIHVIQTERTVEGLKEWKEEGANSLLKGWYLVSRFQYAELDYVGFKNEINRLTNRIWLEMRTGMNLTERLMVINRMLFVHEKYRANRRSLHDPKNYFLNSLTETKKGAPISLGMLYLILCEELELPIKGIVLPGYFVLVHPEKKNEFFIDVLNKGAFFLRKELDRFLKDMEVEKDDKYYQPHTNLDIIKELISTLMNSYRQRKQHNKADRMQVLLDALGAS